MNGVYSIENKSLKINLASKGAELTSIYNKKEGLEYLWSGDKKFWGEQSPVLFPIVGIMKDNKYFLNGQPYQMKLHGFARHMEFSLVHQSDSAISFRLESNEETLKDYPYNFLLTISYSLKHDTLHVTYSVKNTSTNEMYFSLGAHPGIRVPLTENTTYNDYYLEFNHHENAEKWVSSNGLILTKTEKFFENSNQIPLTRELFFNGALIFKNLQSNEVSLKCHKSKHGVTMNFTDFPIIAFWASKNADFVCLEPWCGIGDSVDADQQIEHKEGIQKIKPAEIWERTWLLTIF